MSQYSDKLLHPLWQKKRLELMVGRDCHECKKCGSKDKILHLHHRHYIYGRDPWDYPNELLITLCDKCHQEEEENADIGKQLVKSLHFWGYFNTEIRDELNRLITLKMEANANKNAPGLDG